MRIRQRKVPFPISSLSPIPLSDLYLSRSPVVQLQLHSNPHGNDPPPLPSDQPNQSIGAGNNGPDAAAGGGVRRQAKVVSHGGEEEKGEEGESSNDTTRKGSFLGAEIQTMNILQQSSSSHQAIGGRWYEGERAFPLKKRRGSFERGLSDEMIKEKEKRLMKTKMKTKTNKKCGERHEEEDEEDNAIKLEGVERSWSVKIKDRGGALLEGSRCSRVNGRGWRCCQQTLVGYSLCEHHLGKGRLRSMNSVRNRSMANSSAPKKNKSQTPSRLSVSLQEEEETKGSSLIDKVGCVQGDDDVKKALVKAKKKTNKLGMVKARSISSLLGQSTNATAAAENNE